MQRIERHDLLVFSEDLGRYDENALDGTGWRNKLDAITDWAAANRTWEDRQPGMRYQWTALRIEISHAAVVAARYHERRLNKYTPARLLRAMQTTINMTKGRQRYLFTWYANSKAEATGRAWEKSPGLQSIPKSFRWALLAGNHAEYDMDMAHVRIYVAFAGETFAPKLSALAKAMEHPGEKRRISGLIPGTHGILGPALGAPDPTSWHGFPYKKARELNMGMPEFYVDILQEIKRERPTVMEFIKG